MSSAQTPLSQSDAAYASGYDDGLDDGYAESRRPSRDPLVVHDARGTHTYRDQGYSPQHYAHLFVCDEHGCRQIGLTDEFAALYRVQAEGGSLPLHRTAANVGVSCSTCDDGGCPDCTDPA